MRGVCVRRLSEGGLAGISQQGLLLSRFSRLLVDLGSFASSRATTTNSTICEEASSPPSTVELVTLGVALVPKPAMRRPSRVRSQSWFSMSLTRRAMASTAARLTGRRSQRGARTACSAEAHPLPSHEGRAWPSRATLVVALWVATAGEGRSCFNIVSDLLALAELRGANLKNAITASLDADHSRHVHTAEGGEPSTTTSSRLGVRLPRRHCPHMSRSKDMLRWVIASGNKTHHC